MTRNKRWSVSNSTRSAVFHKTNGKCFYCGAALEEEHVLDDNGKEVSTVSFWAVDHFIPLSKGGDYKLENLVPACIQCNTLKRDMTIDEFRSVFKREFYFETQGIKVL